MKVPLAAVLISLFFANYCLVFAVDDSPKTDTGGKVMTEEPKMTATEFHKKMAVDLFNATWDYIDKADRSPEDVDAMLLSAYASCYHWSVIGEPLNQQRGQWMISRVYAVLGRGEPALYHAQRCLDITKQNNIGDFDAAFANEAMARAYAALGNKLECAKYYDLAKEAGKNIASKEDRDYFYQDLDGGNWFGMR
jgi:hypothetical protein